MPIHLSRAAGAQVSRKHAVSGRQDWGCLKRSKIQHIWVDVQTFVSKKGHQRFSSVESHLNIRVAQWLVLDACLLHGAFPENTQSNKECCLGMWFLCTNEFSCGVHRTLGSCVPQAIQDCWMGIDSAELQGAQKLCDWHQHHMRSPKRDFIG